MQNEDEELIGISNKCIDALCDNRNIPKNVAMGSASLPEEDIIFDSYTKSLRKLAIELSIDYKILDQLASIESQTGSKPNTLLSSGGAWQYAIRTYRINSKKGPKVKRTLIIPAWRKI